MLVLSVLEACSVQGVHSVRYQGVGEVTLYNMAKHCQKCLGFNAHLVLNLCLITSSPETFTIAVSSHATVSSVSHYMLAM